MAIASSSSSISSQEIIINKKSRSSSSSSNSSVDRLTSLPDSLRLHILSLLPYLSAVRTSALSYAWRHLYKSRAHNLTFNLLGPTSDLAAYAGPIDTLRLYCRRSSFLLPSVGYCNSSGRICDLTLRLFDNSLDLNGDTAIIFAFPPSLFRLTVINLHLVLPPPQVPITFPFLEILNLERVCIADHALKAVLAGCMSLRTLDIRLCAGLSEIVVPGRGLGVRSVTIVDCPQLTKLRVEGRHLRRFHFFGNGFLEGCRFDEACKLELEDVYMSYGAKKAAEEEDEDEDDEEEEEEEEREDELPQGWFASWWVALGRLQHIKVLTLCDVSLRVTCLLFSFFAFMLCRDFLELMKVCFSTHRCVRFATCHIGPKKVQ